MKSLTFLFAISLSIVSTAQIQVGLVREFHSQKKPIGGVQVNFIDAVPTASGDDGYFRLAFTGKNPGDLILLNEVKKAGYELVNKTDLERIQFTRNMALAEDLILAKMGVIDAAKMKYYQVSATALTAKYEQDKKTLTEKLKKAMLSQQDWEEQAKQLQKEVEKQQKNLETYADKFARMNPDDMSRLEQEALALFKTGNINGAIKKLEAADLIGRLKNNIEEKRKIIKGTLFQAELYALNLQMNEAEELYDNLLELDSMDLEALQSAADFYKEQHRYAKALLIYPKINAHPNAQPWQQAKTYSSRGDIYISTGYLSEALRFSTMLFQHYDTLSKKDSTSLFYKHNLAQSLSMMGQIHVILGNFRQALQLYKQFQQIEKHLCSTSIDNTMYKNSLAIALLKLGSLEFLFGNLKEAMVQYEEAFHLQMELSAAYPTNIDFKHNLAVTYLRMGETATSLGSLQQALLHYQNHYRIEEEMHRQYPDNITFKAGFGTASLVLGQALATMGNLQQALEYYLQYFHLENEVHTLYPDDVNFKSSLAQACVKLGDTYTTLGYMEQGKEYYEQYYNLTFQLSTDYPTNIEYKSSLGNACLKLGESSSSLEDLPKAFYYFKEYYELEKKLYAQYPDMVKYKNEWAIASSEIGRILLKQGNLQDALLYYKEFLQLAKELCEAYPDEINFKGNLPIAYGCLGEIYEKLSDLPLALAYSKEYLKLNIEICSKYSDNTIHQRNLAGSYEQIGLLQHKLGEIKEALSSIQHANNLREALYNKFPNKLHEQELAVSTKRLGLIQLFAGNYDSSNYYLEKSHLLFEKSSLGISKDFQISYFLGTQYQEYAHFCDSLKNPDGAIYFLLKSIDFFKSGKQSAPDSANWQAQISISYGSIAYYCLLLKRFPEAEQYALTGLVADSNQTWIHINLMLAYIYQNKWNQAEDICPKLKDIFNSNRMIKDILLQVLKDLESAGITHPDVEKAKKLLQQKND